MIVALALIFGIRALLSVLLPPVADEAYYLIWANHLSWAYVDHPGMVAWLLAGMRGIISDPFIAARVLSALLYAAAIGAIYSTLRTLGKGPSVAAAAALTFMLIPYHFVVGITYQVEQPLIAGTAIAIWAWVRLTTTQQNHYFYILAVALAAILNTKLTAGLLAVGFALLVALVPTRWAWLKRAHFWGGAGVVFAGMMPFLYWQVTHEWISFMFHVKRVGETVWFQYFFEFMGNQLLYLSPVILAWFWVSVRQRPRSIVRRDMLVLSGILWIPFALLSIKTQVYPHWPIIATIPMVIAIADAESPCLRRWLMSTSVFTGLVLAVLLLVQPSYLRSEVRHNRQVVHQLQGKIAASPTPPKILSDFHGSVGILSILTGYPVGMTQAINAEHPRWGDTQIAQWETGDIPKGRDALLWIEPTPQLITQLATQFKTVTSHPEWQLTVLEPHISKKQFIWCENAIEATRL